ncbi:helix-turn-helix domain-containing protein [Nocardia sp. CA-119907]|uniref:helix-turn-helix domain-containing protein n=1 Tax=Nocardia sp. CA-119907 TaxID=3239973 RepID=UPI003D9859D0
MTGLDEGTKATLQVLGQVALRLAEGQSVEKDWLIEQFADNRAGGSTGKLLTVAEACARLRISRSNLYNLIHQRELATVKIGRRRFVPAGETDRYIQQLIRIGGQQ